MGENRRVVDVGCGELGRDCLRRNDGGARQQTLQRGVPPDQRIDLQHCRLAACGAARHWMPGKRLAFQRC